MAVDLFIEPATHQFGSLDVYRYFKWEFLPDPICEMIARECQYLELNQLLLNRLMFTAEGKINEKPYSAKLKNNLRAGLIKSTLFNYGSIAEAALRAIAELRGYDLPNNENHRTFGKVLGAWQLIDESPREELKEVWPSIKELYNLRNNIHLFKALNDGTSEIDYLISNEKRLIREANRLLEVLASIDPNPKPTFG